MLRKVPGAISLRGCGTTTWPGLSGCLNLAWSPLPPARTQPSRSSRLMIAALFMVCNFTHATAAGNSTCSSDKFNLSDLKSLAERFRAGNRTRSPSPLSPASFFRVSRRRSFPWLPSAQLPSWRPSFGFRQSCCRPFPWLLSVANLMGRVWEGATAPLPIERVVSEANSFWGGPGGILTPVLLRRSRVIHRRFLARAD